MEKIKHNRVKLTIIPKYSITSTKVNSTLTITKLFNNYANTTKQ